MPDWLGCIVEFREGFWFITTCQLGGVVIASTEKKIELRQCLSREGMAKLESALGEIVSLEIAMIVSHSKIRESGLCALVICVLVGRHRK
jgi:hypothetical protein